MRLVHKVIFHTLIQIPKCSGKLRIGEEVKSLSGSVPKIVVLMGMLKQKLFEHQHYLAFGTMLYFLYILIHVLSVVVSIWCTLNNFGCK